MPWVKARLPGGLSATDAWALGPARHYFLRGAGETPWFPVILQLDGIDVAELERALGDMAHEAEQSAVPGFRIPGLYRRIGASRRQRRYIAALMTEAYYGLLSHGHLRTAVPRSIVGLPLPAFAVCGDPDLEAIPMPRGRPEPGTVVMGVIDDGIAFAHERFRMADGGTRVEYAWIQDAPCPGPESPVLYGREYRKPEIDETLGECTTAGTVDEDRLYRRLGVVDFGRPGFRPAAARAAHGTHVMDLACGYEPGGSSRRRRGRETDGRPIVCVQLPVAATADTSGGHLQPHLQHAIDYVIDRADRIALARGCGPLPVVINFSYGILAGPHDGTHPIEAAIDDAIRTRANLGAPLRVVLPAGNGHLARCHATIRFAAPGDTEELPWRVLPDDRTTSMLEIWMPRGAPGKGRIEVRVATPSGEASGWLGEADGQAWQFKCGADVVAMLSYEHVAAPTDRGRFVVSLLPTADLDAPTALAPSGTWHIGLRNRRLAAEDRVEAWIQRDDVPFGYPRRGRQSHFDDPRYRRFDHAGREVETDSEASPVKRDGSISALATGRRTIVIGGFQRKDWRLAKDSAGGPTSAPANAGRGGPDAAGVSDDSRLHPGVLAAGTRSGSAVALRGTSVAAPSVARLVADRLATGRAGDRDAVQQAAAQSEAGAPPGPKPPRRRRGAGRLPRPAGVALERFWR